MAGPLTEDGAHTLPPSAEEKRNAITKIIAASAAGALLVAIGIVGQFIRHSSELDPVAVGDPSLAWPGFCYGAL